MKCRTSFANLWKCVNITMALRRILKALARIWSFALRWQPWMFWRPTRQDADICRQQLHHVAVFVWFCCIIPYVIFVAFCFFWKPQGELSLALHSLMGWLPVPCFKLLLSQQTQLTNSYNLNNEHLSTVTSTCFFNSVSIPFLYRL